MEQNLLDFSRPALVPPDLAIHDDMVAFLKCLFLLSTIGGLSLGHFAYEHEFNEFLLIEFIC